MPAYYDLFNEALDDLAHTLGQVTGLTVVTDPAAINPPCVLIAAPQFTAMTYAVADLSFPVTLIGSGPGGLQTLRLLLNMAAQLMAQKVGVTTGRPRTIQIGGGDYPAYDLEISVKAGAS